MSYQYIGIGQDNITSVKFWWNKTNPSHRNPKYHSIQKAIASKPPDSTILLSNVYADLNGFNRLVGSAAFWLRDLQGQKSIQAPVQRVYADQTSGKLVLSFPKALQLPSSTHRSFGSAIGNAVDMPNHWEVVERHDKHFQDNPKVAHSNFTYFKWPHFYFGIGNSVPGWRFNHLKPEISSGADFFQQSLEIAKARSNLRGPFQDQNDENKGVLLGLTISAYPNSTPYSLETDPAKPGQPTECFQAARLRSRGDCEDVSWEVNTNFKELIGLNVNGNEELKHLQNCANEYSCFMTLGSATQADATTGPGAKSTIMAHMYSLLLPNHYLKQIGHPNQSKTARINTNTEPKIVEGTGLEWPHQTPNATFPRAFTPIGQAFTNEMTRSKSAPGSRRMIFDPGNEKNGFTVGEFYKHVITAASVDPNVGLLEFRNENGELGAKLVDILKMNADGSVVVKTVPGTAYSDMTQKEQENERAIIGLHEPIPPLFFDKSEKLPTSKLVSFVHQKFQTPIGPDTSRDTMIVFPAQEIGQPAETKLINYLQKMANRIQSIHIEQHTIADVGSIQLNINLKK